MNLAEIKEKSDLAIKTEEDLKHQRVLDSLDFDKFKKEILDKKIEEKKIMGKKFYFIKVTDNILNYSNLENIGAMDSFKILEKFLKLNNPNLEITTLAIWDFGPVNAFNVIIESCQVRSFYNRQALRNKIPLLSLLSFLLIIITILEVFYD